MRTPFVALSLLAASAMADLVAYTNAKSFGAMLKRGDTILKRQGYTPDTDLCGSGNTCAEACGPNSVQCPSTDTSMLYCHDDNDGSKCCHDGSGNACHDGYYCTSDSAGDTYCCPDGIDTAACALEYSLSVSLVRQTAVITSSAAPLDTILSAETPVSTSLPDDVSSEAPVSSRASGTARTSTPPTNRSSASSTAPAPSQFTGGAGKVVGAGAAVVVGAMGFARLL
ncbi:PRP 4 C domain-containing protein [Stagonosporopsis vannaccii]|nr:PRP 4 C domain-containing protein [Stagonosporopsis vannaccii]